MDAGRETYLDVKGSGDPTLGEESALVDLKRKSSEILLFEVLVGRVNGHHKISRNDWEISCCHVRNFFPHSNSGRLHTTFPNSPKKRMKKVQSRREECQESESLS